MTQIYNVYCDESCHLENDHQKVMTLGAIWCPIEKVKEISVRLREIKQHHNLKPNFEVKWTKVSPAKVQFYLDWMDYFFDNDDLHFRSIIVSDKSKLQHQEYNQTHDDWYYKMYFNLIKVILYPKSHYRIYLDIKDTKSADKISKLHDILANNFYDFSHNMIERLQTIHSHESEILQLTDLLIGAVGYANRKLSENSAKLALIERMRDRSKYSLLKTTLPQESKVNILIWQASQR